jgi:hypothetical protein
LVQTRVQSAALVDTSTLAWSLSPRSMVNKRAKYSVRFRCPEVSKAFVVRNSEAFSPLG